MIYFKNRTKVLFLFSLSIKKIVYFIFIPNDDHERKNY